MVTNEDHFEMHRNFILFYFASVSNFSEVIQSCLTLCDPMEPARLFRLRDFPGKNTGVGCHFLLQHRNFKSPSYVMKTDIVF